MKSIPAMPPIGPSFDAADYAKRALGACSLAPFYAHWAFFYAQSLVHLDGKRRRVFKREGMWQIEVAS
jgi:hypothetical protein